MTAERVTLTTRLRDLPRRGLTGLVRGYRFFFKPWLGNACRFEPTCSAYALDALRLHGATAGSYLAVRRILRCNPLCNGGCDPVPDVAPPLFTRLLSSKTRP
jgi:putative membrane protein insertion efficiency factor